MVNYSDRLKALSSSVQNATTPAAKAWKQTIYDKIISYIQRSNGDDEVFRQHLWLDYLAWTAWHFDGESVPIFLTKKQFKMYLNFKEYDSNIWLYQRRAGKSLGTAVLVLYYVMTNINKKVLIFAPTEDQLVLMQNIRALLSQDCASALFEQFLGKDVIKGKAGNEDETLSKLGSKFNDKYIRMLNGCDITAVTLNVKGGGSTRRGFSANLIVADEFQDIPPEIREEIIEPIIMDAFSTDKRLVYIGTPHTKIDPKLDIFWEEAKASKWTGTLHSHCWEAVEEGVRTPATMGKRFRSLEIPCRWVLEHGICPVFLPKMYNSAIAESNNKKVAGGETDPTKLEKPVEVDEKGRGVVPCGKICMNNSTFVQEDMAMFPNDFGLAIPPDWVKAAGRDYDWATIDTAGQFATNNLVMSVDYGDVHADTQICVWVKEYSTDSLIQTQRLRLVYQEVVNDLLEVGVKNPSAGRVKAVFHAFKPKAVVVDVTGKKDQITELIVGDSPIPRHVFWSNEAAEKNGVVGMWWNGPMKSDMFKNFKEQLRLNKMIVPNRDIVFWDKWFNEIISLKPEPATMTRQYIYWGQTLHLTDAAAMAALVLQKDHNIPAYGEAMTFSLDGEDDEDS